MASQMANTMMSSAVVGVGLSRKAPSSAVSTDFTTSNKSSTAFERMQPKATLKATSMVSDVSEITDGKSTNAWRNHEDSDQDQDQEMSDDVDRQPRSKATSSKGVSKESKRDFDVHAYVSSLVKSALTVEPTQSKKAPVKSKTTQKNGTVASKSLSASKTLSRARSAEDRLASSVPQAPKFSEIKPRKSRASEEYEARKREKELLEEAECAKSGKFRATEAPPTVYLPIFDEMMQRQRARSAETREYCKQILLAQVQPFKFEEREAEKLRQSTEARLQKEAKDQKLKAHQSRKSVAEVKEQFQREEEKRIELEIEREFQRKRNVETLLLQSRSPVPIDRNRAQVERTPSFQPRVNKSVPDFDGVYRRFLQQSEQYHSNIKTVKCSSFSLHTDQRIRERQALKNIEKEIKQIIDDDVVQKAQKPPGSLKIFFQEDVPAVLLNKTVELRLSKNRDRAQEIRKFEAELRAKLAEEAKRQLEAKKRLARPGSGPSIITEKPKSADDPYGKKQYWETKTRELLSHQKSRDKEYDQELDKIQNRLRDRPTLAEQERLFAAKQSAERRYKQTLKLAGLDPALLEAAGTQNTNESASATMTAPETDYSAA